MARKKKEDPIPFSLDRADHIYKPEEVEMVLEQAVNEGMLKKKRNGPYYYNVPCSFDIEASSFYMDPESGPITLQQKLERCKTDALYNPPRAACMYVWQFCINGFVIMGRTWPEFVSMMLTIQQTLDLDAEKKRLPCYVHNLSYEFQFICRWFEWAKIFAMDVRKVLYAATTGGVEFRCSYLESGYNLEKLGDELRKYKVAKKTGDLDYTLIRHSGTPLTEAEIGYCVNDVLVVAAYIQERIEAEKSVTNILYTKTGYVRKYCRSQCLWIKSGDKVYKNDRYRRRIQDLTLNGADEYRMLKEGFQGGFTHANHWHSGKTLQDVHSYDFTSSYPAVMLTEGFPMSRGIKVQITNDTDFLNFIQNYCMVFEVTFEGLFCDYTNETYISASKCKDLVGGIEDNGRVLAATRLTTTITNVDFEIIARMYRWERMSFGPAYVYRKGRLPKELVLAILQLYGDKTRLKGVAGQEVRYMVSKGMLNSCYGMMVTDIVRDVVEFTNEWRLFPADTDEQIAEYNESESRFHFYPWGVFVTAWARRNLFSGIFACGRDYVYADTDSIKVLNVDSHKAYFRAYNQQMIKKLEQAAKYYGIPLERFAPQNIKGEELPIGVWDDEGEYSRFKTLGAKRYMVEKNKAVNITVSGVNKVKAVPYLETTFGSNTEIFDRFEDGLLFTVEATGKLVHDYIDIEISGTVTDYTGRTGKFLEKSCVHFEPTTYEMGLGEAYRQHLLGLRPDMPDWERKENA